MFDLDKLKDNAIFWVFRFDEIRKVASGCGWAVGVHGSVVHDLDLMAMPWVKEHVTADELAETLARIVVSKEYYREPVKSSPGEKPNGRIVYTIFAGNTYIDLNVIERDYDKDEQPEHSCFETIYKCGKKPHWKVGDTLAYYEFYSDREGECALGKVAKVEINEEVGDWLYTFEDGSVYDEETLLNEETYKKN